MALSIATIIQVGFPAVLEEMITSKGYRWANTFLNGLTEMRGIRFMQLGATVELGNGTRLDVQEYTTPLTWTKIDELKNNIENTKIPFCKAMLENLITSHEDGLAEFIWKDPGQFYVVGENYHHALSDVIDLQNAAARICYLRTAIVKVPRRGTNV